MIAAIGTALIIIIVVVVLAVIGLFTLLRGRRP
jgi:hypothetical protein